MTDIDRRRYNKNIDAVQENADWTKQEWDLPTDVDGFLLSLGLEDATEHRRRMVLHDFMEHTPAANHMPDELREELDARGYLPRDEEVPHVDNAIPRRVVAQTIGSYEGLPDEVTGNLAERTDKETGERRTFVMVEHDGRDIYVSVDPDSIEPALGDDEDE